MKNFLICTFVAVAICVPLNFARAENQSPAANALNVIAPYKHEGMWVFDDASKGLSKEPFIAGADEIITRGITKKKIDNAEKGFRIIFSGGEFPGYDLKFKWLRADNGGNYYWSEDFKMEGWLCPALDRYFQQAPQELYIRFESLPATQRKN
jgi:hypothetical protein